MKPTSSVAELSPQYPDGSLTAHCMEKNSVESLSQLSSHWPLLPPLACTPVPLRKWREMESKESLSPQ